MDALYTVSGLYIESNNQIWDKNYSKKVMFVCIFTSFMSFVFGLIIATPRLRYHNYRVFSFIFHNYN